MTQTREWVSTGLVFLSKRDIDIIETTHRARATLEAIGQRVLKTRVQTMHATCLETADYHLKLSLHEEYDQAPLKEPAALYLSVRLRPGENGLDQCDTVRALVLADLHRVYRADSIDWIGHGVLIPGEEFAMATQSAASQDVLAHRPKRPTRHTTRTPRPVRRVCLLPDINESRDRLDRMLADDGAHPLCRRDPDAGQRQSLRDVLYDEAVEKAEPAKSPALLRLSAWLLSYAVALLCLPVGIALLFINMRRGENLRLSSQTAALTGTFVTFQATGSMAQAAETIQILLL